MSKLSLVILALIPSLTSAHVKWFAESNNYVRPYGFTDTPVLIWLAVLFFILIIGIYLEKKLEIPKWCRQHFPKWASTALSLASVGFGLSFLIFSYKGFVFAPNLLAEGSVGTMLLILQAVSGFMILLGLYERVGAIILLVLFGLSIKEYGVYEMIDSLEILGFAIYLIIIGRPKWCLRRIPSLDKIFNKIQLYGVPFLRVGTGLNLIVLGFTEKILTPSLTQNFLTNYQWNFMQAIGFETFTNYWFAFSAGAVEVVFGLFFLFGLVTRLTTALLAVFLITTLALLGPMELVGHLPHFSIAIVLIVLGSGSKLKLLKS